MDPTSNPPPPTRGKGERSFSSAAKKPKRPHVGQPEGGEEEDEEETEDDDQDGLFPDSLPSGINLAELHQFLSANQMGGQGQKGAPLHHPPAGHVDQQMHPGSSLPISLQQGVPQLMSSHTQQPNQLIQQLYPSSQYNLLASSAANGIVLSTRPLSSMQPVTEEQLAKRQKIRAEADALSNANMSSANPSLPPLLIATSHGIVLESGGMAFSTGGLPSPLTSADQIHMLNTNHHASNEGLGGSAMTGLVPTSVSSQSHHHLPSTAMTHITDAHVASHSSHHPTSLPKVPPLSATEQQQRIEEMLIMSGAGHVIEVTPNSLCPIYLLQLPLS